MGNYHPHGDSAIYDTLVRMAQDFSLRYPLVDGQGNFGSIDDDPAAAMRYTEARLTRLATEMLRDIDMDTVDFGPNYDGRTQEPLVLPARFPNLLVNGSTGHRGRHGDEHPAAQPARGHRRDVAFIDDPEITIDDLMKHVKGPDFPTGGMIIGRQGIRDAYETGRGRVRVRAQGAHRAAAQGKEAIIVTELPYMVKKGGDGGLITKIADLVHDKKITDITDLRDESDRNGMRLVIELKRDAIPKVVLNQLYKHTTLQSTFGVNTVALVDGVPRTLSLREIIEAYVEHQREVVIRRAKYELGAKEAPRARPRGPADRARQPRRGHRADPRLAGPRDRARAADGALRPLRDPGAGDPRHAPRAADRARVRRDPAGARRPHRAHPRAARDPRRRGARPRRSSRRSSSRSRERYADERRTEITAGEDEIDIEDMIADQQMVITITHSGYIKRCRSRPTASSTAAASA